MAHTTLLVLSLASVLPSPASAQVAQWSDRFGCPGVVRSDGVSGVVFDQVVHDDGSGPAIYACGAFDAAGNAAAKHLARWDGQTWRAFPGSTELAPVGSLTLVRFLETLDTGSGRELYAAGSFSSIGGVSARNVARWTGATWAPLGAGPNNGIEHNPIGMRVLDDGVSEALYVMGGGSDIGGLGPNTLAKWDGVQWSTVGAPLGGLVQDVAFFDDGSGTKLYVGGRDLNFGGAQTAPVVVWAGASWQAVGSLPGWPAQNWTTRLEVFDDGAGPRLFACGVFHATGVVGAPVSAVAAWDGSTWSVPGGGVLQGAASGFIEDVAVFDAGSGPALHVLGNFTTAGGQAASQLARWDGVAWSGSSATPIFETGPDHTALSLYDLCVFDDGSAEQLHVAGAFGRAGGVRASCLARWNGAQWATVGGGDGMTGAVRALHSSSGELLAGGSFALAGATPVSNLAKWNGVQWADWNGGANDDVTVIDSFDLGAGPVVHVAGSFETIGGASAVALARWNGAQFVAPSSQVLSSNTSIDALAAYSSGAGLELIASGPNTFASRISSTAFVTLGSPSPKGVLAFAVHDDGAGAGAQLYAGGTFLKIGTQFVWGIARWNGSTWGPVGGGFSYTVHALVEFDDGSGNGSQLYAGGAFATANGAPCAHVARWNGSAWAPLGAGLNDTVRALAVFDDGAGPALYAGGDFSASGSTPMAHLARWNGTSWSAVDGGLDGDVHALEVHDDGAGFGPALYVGGEFAAAGEHASVRIARYGRECGFSTYCTSGTTSSGCVPTIGASGSPSASAPSGFTLQVTGVEGQRLGHFFYGVNGAHAATWGGSTHFLCVKAPTQRTGTQNSGGTSGACDGAMALDWNAYIATHPTALGAPFSAGANVWAQLFFRDPAGPKTSALSNGLSFSVCP